MELMASAYSLFQLFKGMRERRTEEQHFSEKKTKKYDPAGVCQA
jgi:hypothetical protein